MTMIPIYYILLLVIPLILTIILSFLYGKKKKHIKMIIMILISGILYTTVLSTLNPPKSEFIEKELKVVSIDNEYYYFHEDSDSLTKLNLLNIRHQRISNETSLTKTTVMKYFDIFFLRFYRINESDTYYSLLAPQEVYDAMEE